MKKTAAVLLSFGLVFGCSYGAGQTAEAKTKVKTYQNCKALNKVYKGGVAKSSKVKNKGGRTQVQAVCIKSALQCK